MAPELQAGDGSGATFYPAQINPGNVNQIYFPDETDPGMLHPEHPKRFEYIG
ncbi:MAG: hypothetical protein GX882_01865 [Methanomicrobiales archaeon]|nr:hypothetical protein [Methanomicrobiales archaeon]